MPSASPQPKPPAGEPASELDQTAPKPGGVLPDAVVADVAAAFCRLLAAERGGQWRPQPAPAQRGR